MSEDGEILKDMWYRGVLAGALRLGGTESAQAGNMLVCWGSHPPIAQAHEAPGGYEEYEEKIEHMVVGVRPRDLDGVLSLATYSTATLGGADWCKKLTSDGDAITNVTADRTKIVTSTPKWRARLPSA